MSFEVTWDDPADAAFGWRRARDNPLLRLYEHIQEVYFDSLRVCYEATGSPMARDHILRVVNGYPYARGEASGDAGAMERLKQHSRQVGEAASYYNDTLRPEVVGIIERLRKHPRPTSKLPELVEHLEECIHAYAHIIGDLHWRMAGAAVAARMASGAGLAFDWPDRFHEITCEPASDAALLLGGTANPLSSAIKKMRALAKVAQSDDELRRVVEEQDVDGLGKLPGRPAVASFRRGFRALLRRHGQRTGVGWGSNVGIGDPTWNVAPRIPLQMIATYARSDLDSIDRKAKAASAQRRRVLARVRRKLAADPGRLAEFEEEYERALRMAIMMEDHNDWMDQSAPGVMREAIHLIGRRLVRDDAIDDPGDVVHVSIAELKTLAAGEGVGDLRTLVSERKREHEERKGMDAPEAIGEGQIPARPELDDKGQGLVGAELHGVAASSGTYTGRAVVRMPVPGPPDVEEGDILVAVDAGPDWTPLFAVLGAVVLDKGNALQHAAVMAREFGIPAVTGTQVGTSTITDGQVITVDGAQGIVELQT